MGGVQAAAERHLLGGWRQVLTQGQRKGSDPEPRVLIVWATVWRSRDPKGLTDCAKHSIMTSNNSPNSCALQKPWS